MNGVIAAIGGAPASPRATATMETAYPSRPTAAAEMRRDLRDFLARQAVDTTLALEMVLAADEAFVNAVAHAGAGAVRLSACVSQLEASVEVHDEGGGFRFRRPDLLSQPDRSRPCGRGLFLIGSMMDEVSVRSGRDGTTVRMVKRLA